jgi:DNA-binding NtrC family response regulator
MRVARGFRLVHQGRAGRLEDTEHLVERKHRILIADDEQGMRDLLDADFSERGFEVHTASNGDKAVEVMRESPCDIVITDLKMPGRDGLAVLRAVREINTDAAVIVITAYGTIETAVEAMRLGAKDFVAKPFKLVELERKVEKLLRPLNVLPAQGGAKEGLDLESGIVGDSPHTRHLHEMIAKIAPSKSSVLITGPSGTGKELVARAIHDASARRERPFVALNCAALAPGVLESELFGHEKGAFTGATTRRVGRFERAHTGTLLLDEVAEVDPNIQTKLLRVLQEGEFERVGGTDSIRVDVRIVAATNQDLRRAIAEGRLREDLYYRLNVFSLKLEPLRNRPEDVPALVQHFLTKFRDETGKEVAEVDPEVMDFFMNYRWPGNVRELENVVERAVVLAEGGRVTWEELPPEMLEFDASAMIPAEPAGPSTAAPQQPAAAESAGEANSLTDHTEQMESQMIREALERFRWNKTKAARHLGLKRTTLQYKIKKYGLE